MEIQCTEKTGMAKGYNSSKRAINIAVNCYSLGDTLRIIKKRSRYTENINHLRRSQVEHVGCYCLATLLVTGIDRQRWLARDSLKSIQYNAEAVLCDTYSKLVLTYCIAIFAFAHMCLKKMHKADGWKSYGNGQTFSTT